MDSSARQGVPVRWLVGQPALKLLVRAGADALDRMINFAHSIELAEPGPWLRGGELLLTTGLPLPSDPDEQRAYLRSVVAAGVAAVGFGVGLSHREIPPALLDEAEQLGVPLLEVPLSIPFIAVVRAVTARLAELQYEGVVRASRVLPRMTRAALRQGPVAVLRELATALGGRVVVLDQDRNVTLSSGDGHRSAPVEPAPPELPVDPGRADSSVNVSPDGVTAVQVIRVGRRIHGHLVLSTSRGLDPADRPLVEHAVSLIALEQEKPLRVREELAQVNTVVLELLLDGSLEGDRAVGRLARSGLPVRGGLSALVLRGGAAAHLLAAVDDVLLPLGIPRVCLDRGTEVVAVLPVSPHGLAVDVVRAAATRIAPAAVRAGVATTRKPDLAEAIHRATTAADSATSRRQRMVDAASMAGFVLIADPATRVVLSRLADSLLGSLIEHDRRTGSSMLATLRTFLDHNGNIGTAASALAIHRHTLRARIERIREILDFDLDSAHVRAELVLALSSRSD